MIHLPNDTRIAIGEFAENCQSRSLLLDKFIIQKTFDEYREASLNRVLTTGEKSMRELRQKANKDIKKQQKRINAEALLAATEDPPHANAVECNPLRWTKVLPQTRLRSIRLHTASRLAIGLSSGVLENCGITIHRLWGQPYLPGSAIKGVACDAALIMLSANEITKEQFDSVFSTVPAKQTDGFTKGAVCFLDAFPLDPQCILEYDISTPHYQSYYGHKGNHNAEDIEAPIPLAFPVIGKNQEFRFIITCPNPHLLEEHSKAALDLAEKCLRKALTERGIGAKTSSGYGWFIDQNPPAHQGSILDKWRGKGDNAMKLAEMLPELILHPNMAELVEALPEIVGPQHWKFFKKNNPYWAAFNRHKDGKTILAHISRTLI